MGTPALGTVELKILGGTRVLSERFQTLQLHVCPAIRLKACLAHQAKPPPVCLESEDLQSISHLPGPFIMERKEIGSFGKATSWV